MVSGWRTFSSCEPRRHHAIVFRHNWTLCSEPVWLCSRLPQNLNYHAGKTKRHATSSAISPIVPMLYSTNSWTSSRTSSAMWYTEMSRLAKQQVFSTIRLAEGSQRSRYSRHAGLLHRIRGKYKASPTVDRHSLVTGHENNKLKGDRPGGGKTPNWLVRIDLTGSEVRSKHRQILI
jgi:hypothetical protein